METASWISRILEVLAILATPPSPRASAATRARSPSLDGPDRIVTFFTGAVARERLIDLDESARRLVWSVVEGPYTHDNASAQVLDEPQGRTRFVWVNDFLPADDELV